MIRLDGKRELSGRGFLQNRPKTINKLISNNKGSKVDKIEVCRVPVSKVFIKILNVMSFGALKRNMKKKDYDKLFHLYTIIYLDNGNSYRIEKNQRMKVYKFSNKDKSKNTECLEETLSKPIDLKKFITAPEKNKKNLYQYNGFKENCQNYTKRLMNYNGINKFDDFILQDVFDLVPKYVKIIAKSITNIAGTVDYIIKGGDNMSAIIYNDIINSA